MLSRFSWLGLLFLFLSGCSEDKDGATEAALSCGAQVCPMGTGKVEYRSVSEGRDVSDGDGPSDGSSTGGFGYANFTAGECSYTCVATAECPEGTWPIITEDCFTCAPVLSDYTLGDWDCDYDNSDWTSPDDGEEDDSDEDEDTPPTDDSESCTEDDPDVPDEPDSDTGVPPIEDGECASEPVICEERDMDGDGDFDSADELYNEIYPVTCGTVRGDLILRGRCRDVGPDEDVDKYQWNIDCNGETSLDASYSGSLFLYLRPSDGGTVYDFDHLGPLSITGVTDLAITCAEGLGDYEVHIELD